MSLQCPDSLPRAPASTWHDRILSLANGAQFFTKCALVGNPFEYTVRRFGNYADAKSESEYNEKLIAALTAAGIEVISQYLVTLSRFNNRSA